MATYYKQWTSPLRIQTGASKPSTFRCGASYLAVAWWGHETCWKQQKSGTATSIISSPSRGHDTSTGSMLSLQNYFKNHTLVLCPPPTTLLVKDVSVLQHTWFKHCMISLLQRLDNELIIGIRRAGAGEHAGAGVRSTVTCCFLSDEGSISTFRRLGLSQSLKLSSKALRSSSTVLTRNPRPPNADITSSYRASGRRVTGGALTSDTRTLLLYYTADYLCLSQLSYWWRCSVYIFRCWYYIKVFRL